jgi:phosphorylcholine metabolism protein LicD
MDGLREAMVVDYGDRYFFGGLSPADGNDPNCQMKIMLTGTTYTEIQNTSFPFPRGIGIDTFPICHMPKNRLMEKIRQKHGQMLMHIIAVEMEYRYPPSSLLDKKADKKIRHYYKFRQFLGFLFSFHSLMYWKNRYIRFCSKEFNNSEFLSIGEDFRFNLCGNQVTKKTLEESAYSFEGHSLISIKGYDSYLETYYGDYMTFPVVQKRDKHIVASVTFLDKATK